MTTACPHCQLPQRVIDGKIETHPDPEDHDDAPCPCLCPGSGTAAPQAEGEPPWGIERTSGYLWVGPMRSDGVKVNEVVFGIAIDGLTPESTTRKIAHADRIVQAVNHTGSNSDTIREVESKLSQERSDHARIVAELRKELAEEKVKCKETAKDFEIAFRLLRQENDAIRAAMRTTEEGK